MFLNEVFAFVADTPEGQERLLSVKVGELLVPLVTETRDQIDQYRPAVQEIAKSLGAPVRLIRYASREQMDVIR